jgi:hypothetical protein
MQRSMISDLLRITSSGMDRSPKSDIAEDAGALRVVPAIEEYPILQDLRRERQGDSPHIDAMIESCSGLTGIGIAPWASPGHRVAPAEFPILRSASRLARLGTGSYTQARQHVG